VLRWRHIIIALGLIALVGCSLPKWTVFQKKIDPKLTAPSPVAIEAQREAAQFIEVKSTVVEPDAASQMREIHTVAAGLSDSLGEPKKQITVRDYSGVIEELRAGKLAEQKKKEQWRAFAQKYANVPLEDTGFNLAGPAGLLGLFAVIAACVACPALGYLILRVIPVLWGFFRSTTTAIATFAADNPDAGDELKNELSRKMDGAHKRLVKRIKPQPETA